MGFDINIFEEVIDDELKCFICRQVVEKPLKPINCQHLFCEFCIISWLKENNVCPIDNNNLTLNDLKQPSKIILKLINNLKVKCIYFEYGCDNILCLSNLNQHINNCKYKTNFNPKINKKNFLKRNDNLIKSSDLSLEIKKLKQLINDVNSDFEIENKFQLELNKNLKLAQKNCDNLNKQLKKITDPFFTLLKNNFNTKIKNLDENLILNEYSPYISEEKQYCTAIISNLNEFLNEKIIIEFLRQNDIQVLSCDLQLTIYESSRDFKVIIYKKDYFKLFNENLWPIGVSVNLLEFSLNSFYNDENLTENDKKLINNKIDELKALSQNKDFKIVFGKRQTDLPCLLIKSGLNYWH